MPFTYSNIEYADMIFLYGFCGGSARAAAAEYRRRHPDRRHPNSRVFYKVYQHLRDRGCFPGTSATAERIREDQLGIVQMTIRSPTVSTRRLSSRLGVSRMTAWRTLKRESFHPYHLQKIQHLKAEDFERRLNLSLVTATSTAFQQHPLHRRGDIHATRE